MAGRSSMGGRTPRSIATASAWERPTSNRVVEDNPAIADSLVVDLEYLGQPSRMILFVKPATAAAWSEMLVAELAATLRACVSPHQCSGPRGRRADIPYTLTGKEDGGADQRSAFWAGPCPTSPTPEAAIGEPRLPRLVLTPTRAPISLGVTGRCRQSDLPANPGREKPAFPPPPQPSPQVVHDRAVAALVQKRPFGFGRRPAPKRRCGRESGRSGG